MKILDAIKLKFEANGYRKLTLISVSEYFNERLWDEHNIDKLVEHQDVVLDGCDNFYNALFSECSL